jgi:ssDNA-binding Zn-finger/Zn-ribbon topoisomerase 1
MTHITDIIEPVIGKNGKIKLRQKDTIRGRKVIYAWGSCKYLHLKTKEDLNVTVRIRRYEGTGRKCPNCGEVVGLVEKYKVDKTREDPIIFVADLKCPKCSTIYKLKVNIYGYEKEHL